MFEYLYENLFHNNNNPFVITIQTICMLTGIIFFCNLIINYWAKGYVFFQKCFRKLSRAEYQNKLVANQQ